MRSYLAVLCAGLSTGCGTIYTIQPEIGPRAEMATPVLDEATLNGPIVDKIRIAGWDRFNISAAAVAVDGDRGVAAAASASRTAVAFEHYRSSQVQNFLQKLLEDTGTVTRIFPGARWEIRGSGGVSTLRCPGCVVYTNLMVITLAAFVGIPIYAIRESEVELRVYQDSEFIRAYSGYGRCGTVGTIYWAMWNGINYENRGGPFGGCSIAAAVADAVRQMQDDPPAAAKRNDVPSAREMMKGGPIEALEDRGAAP